jgi:hypothetical protein
MSLHFWPLDVAIRLVELNYMPFPVVSQGLRIYSKVTKLLFSIWISRSPVLKQAV